MGLYHDVAEYKAPDYTPGEISIEDKHKIEKKVLLELKDILNGAGDELFSLWMEFEKNKTQYADIIHQLDKMDAAIQAIYYEKMGYDVKDFYPYTFGKLKDQNLIKTLEILLEKNYPEIDIYDQYFMLLKSCGQKNIFEENIRSL